MIIGDILRQWCTTKKTKAELDYEDTDMTNLVRVRLTDVELTDIEQIDELPGLCACDECEFCDCEECDPCDENKDDPVIEELTSRQGGVIIDIRDDPWDNSQDSQDSENEEFPTIWHELMHALGEQEQSRGLRR